MHGSQGDGSNRGLDVIFLINAISQSSSVPSYLKFHPVRLTNQPGGSMNKRIQFAMTFKSIDDTIYYPT